MLYSFSGSDGSDPFGRLLMDESGNLFGATLTGGDGKPVPQLSALSRRMWNSI